MYAHRSFGFVLYSNRTLLQVWLMGWVMWKEMDCWSTFIWELAQKRRPFLLSEFQQIPDQHQCYTEADRLYSNAKSFAISDPLDWSLWPSTIPRPLEIARSHAEDALINDLTHHAIAFFLLHELHHVTLHNDGKKFSKPFDEEFECDRWAMEYLLAQSDDYSQTSGEDPQKVRSKRAMGVVLGQIVIAHMQSLGLWEFGEEHPPITARMSRLTAVNLPGEDWLWNVACSFLLGTLRRNETLPNRVEFSDQRDLFIKLLHQGDKLSI